MSYTPLRTQYPYGALTNDQQMRIIGRNPPLAQKLLMQEQWNTFERIENYNDIVYQKCLVGLRGTLFYQYASDQEMKNYKAGQMLHIQAYPGLPISTFQAIRDRPLPDVPILEPAPSEGNVPRFSINRPIPTASEQATANAEMEIYAYVSTFNASHYIKYTFADDVEKNAYERAEVRMNFTPTGPPPN